jgi:hypothetical protein
MAADPPRCKQFGPDPAPARDIALNDAPQRVTVVTLTELHAETRRRACRVGEACKHVDITFVARSFT